MSRIGFVTRIGGGAVHITYLREFIEVGLSLNLSKAAKTLHLSQPSLSKHITALEKECGTELLKRSASRIQLTPAGQVLFEESFNLIRAHDETLARVRAMKDVPTLTVCGLFHNADTIGIVNQTLAELNRDGATISVSYQDYRHQSYTTLLKKQKVDMAVTILGPHDQIDDDLERILLFRDPMICLAKKSNPIAERGTIHIQEMEDQVILQPVGSYSTEHGRTTVADIFERYHICPVQQPVFVHSMSELSTVDNDDCVLIMERSMLTSQPFSEDYSVLTFHEDDVTFSFYMLYHKNTANPDLARFVKELAKVVKAQT